MKVTLLYVWHMLKHTENCEAFLQTRKPFAIVAQLQVCVNVRTYLELRSV